MVVSVMLSLLGGRSLVESIYMEMAQDRAEAIARAAQRQAPEAWERLSALSAADALPAVDTLGGLQQAIRHALADSRVEHLKIYDRDGRMIFNTEGDGLGTVERGAAMQDLLTENEP